MTEQVRGGRGSVPRAGKELQEGSGRDEGKGRELSVEEEVDAKLEAMRRQVLQERENSRQSSGGQVLGRAWGKGRAQGIGTECRVLSQDVGH